MITLCSPTYKRYDLLHQLILSAEAGTMVPDRYHIIDNGGTLHLELPEQVLTKIHIDTPGYNMGVAASWNQLLTNNEDYVIISNDDIEVGNNAIELIVRAAERYPTQPFFCIGDSGINAFSFFLQRKWSFDLLGPYDEAFFPAYYEDSDMYRRATLAGYTLQHVFDIDYIHAGSATIGAYSPEEMQKHHDYFRRNTQYYIEKWGGAPHHEKFKTPFDI